MANLMSIERKILGEIERYRQINKYIVEQAVEVPPPAPPADPNAVPPPPAPEGAAPAPSAPPPPPAGGEPQKIDVANDPDVEKVDDEGKSDKEGDKEKGGEGTEELDVTELVDSQKNIEKKQNEYFENLFSQLSTLESKLKEMDGIMNKLNSLETKLEKYREKTPQEKLNLRVYDSYPYNQRLSDFFDDKKEEMELTGKHDYVLTTDDVKDMNVADIKNSFQPGGDLDEYGSKFSSLTR